MTLFLKSFSNYILRGLIIIAPLFLTIFSLYKLFLIIDEPAQIIFEGLFGYRVYGLGLISLIFILAILGYLSSTFILKSLFVSLENWFLKIPLFKEIYKSIKDIVNAFASDKKKFKNPVLVKIYENVYRIGFITNEDLSEYGIKDLIAVYFPLSYAFTGELLIVDKSTVSMLDTSNSGDTMKFIISGGLVNHNLVHKGTR